jgi:serine kinase of HPr protein (carbohydrate metabolism regulator)
MTATVHAGAVLVGERGILVRGAAGSGKSSLILSLLDADPAGTALVADDRVELSGLNGRLIASVPKEIAGLVEIRGQGIVRLPFVSPVVIDLVVDLAPVDECERLPRKDAMRTAVEGIPLPRLFLPVGGSCHRARIRVALNLKVQ